MRIKRKLVSLLVVMTMLMSFMPVVAQAEIVARGYCGDDGDNVIWTLDDEGTLTISGEGDMEDWIYLNDSPWYSNNIIINVIIDKGVTNIGDYAFLWCHNLASITIPDSVTSIGNYAFKGCSSLINITIPNSVTTIGESAFEGCSSLINITIPNSVTFIGDYAFEGCSNLTNITIPNSVTTIGESAFMYCSSLKSITIPNSVTSIGNSAFSSCSSLTSINVDNNNQYYCSVDGNLFNRDKTMLIQYAVGKIDTSYTIPSSVAFIENYAFYNCDSLESVTIPNSVTSIGEESFRYCRSLTNITIPDSVTSIGKYAFHDTAYYNNKQNWTDDVLYIGNHLIEASVRDEYSIKNGTILIADGAFNSCSSLTSITIPNSVTSIGYYAFGGCSSLTNITIPDSVTSIEDGVFSGCSSLESINIPNSVTSIGDEAFYYCSSLTSITIPNGVTSIGNSAFSSCSRLTSINIPNSVTSIGESAFSSCNGLTSITIPDGVTSIGDDAFLWCHNLASITIPDSVTSIGDDAFEYCNSLTSINVDIGNQYYSSVDGNLFNRDKTMLIQYAIGKTDTSYIIPNSVTSIGNNAFYRCNSLKSITIPDGVTSIGDDTFSYCSSLENITIPNSITSIGESMFEYCNSLTSINVDIGNQYYSSVDGNLFNRDKTMLIQYAIGKTDTSYIIPNSVTSIGNNAFSSCLRLTSVTIPNSVTSIGDDAFDNCRSLTSMTIPNSVTSIGDFAFWNCIRLINVIIPNSVTSIGEGAFGYCDSLENVTIPNSITSIGDSAFSRCISLESITIPNSITSIGDFAFGNCSSLTDVYYSGTEEQWSNINISYTNDYLTSATIHYNGTDDNTVTPTPIIPEPLPTVTRALSADFSGGTDIIYDEDENTYKTDSFLLTSTIWNLFADGDWDRNDTSAYNVKVKINLPDGYSFSNTSTSRIKEYTFDEINFTENISETVYLQNPPVGKSTVTAHITGDNINESDFTYDFVIDRYTFDMDIYRANYLTTSNFGKTMEDLYIGMDTPSQTVYKAGQENGMGTAADAWNAVMDTLNVLDRPSSIADYAFEEKDMYEAIIMSLFESSVDYKLMGYINHNIVKKSKELSSTVTSMMKSLYNLDVIDPEAVSHMSDAELKIFEKELGDAFKEVHGAAATTADITKIIGNGIKYGKDIQSLCETIEMYKNIRDLSDSMKQIMRKMYDECPNDNLALKTALFECIATMNAGEKTFTTEMTAYTAFAIGKDVAQYGVDKLWGGVKYSFSVSHPAAFAFQAAYTAGKYVTQVCFNADSIQENYCKIIAMVNMEELLMSLYYDIKSDFQSSSTSDSAKVYNSMVDIMFNMLDTDCDYANRFVGAVEGNLMSSILDMFGDDTAENLQKQIKSIQNSCFDFHEEALTFWLFDLEQENPARFEEYSYLLDKSLERMKKRYNIACPVDVYVFDTEGVIVGSVVDNIPYCRPDANITMAVDGDKKTIYMYGDEEYKISYVGNDTGTMDISIAEYDNDNITRNVYFNNLELTDGLTYTSAETGTTLESNSYILTSENNKNITPGYDTLTDSDRETYTANVERGYFVEMTSVTRQLHTGENTEIAAYIPDGYKFIGWTTDTGEDIFSDSSSITTTICMPAHDVSIIANVIMCPTISISNITDNSVTVNTLNCENTQGIIILALYDESDTLKSIVTQPIAEGVTFNNLDLTNLNIKVMLWNSVDGMTPLADAAKLQLY